MLCPACALLASGSNDPLQQFLGLLQTVSFACLDEQLGQQCIIVHQVRVVIHHTPLQSIRCSSNIFDSILESSAVLLLLDGMPKIPIISIPRHKKLTQALHLPHCVLVILSMN
eukprot:Skav211264  [mRNA]  locus=scaffold3676:195864:196202:- [translate_table: standard]